MKISDNAYIYPELLTENVFGHTKKVQLIRASIENVRKEKNHSGLRILDIGCGSGFAVTRFLGKFGDKILGIDMYDQNIAYAKNHFENNGLVFKCEDVASLSAKEGKFDIIVLADILEHLQSPEMIIEIAASLLSEYGRILITIPNGKGPFEIESFIAKRLSMGPTLLKFTELCVAFLNRYVFKEIWTKSCLNYDDHIPYNSESGHVQFFSKNRITSLIKNFGLEIVKFHNLSFLSGPFTNTIFSPFSTFCSSNTKIANCLPNTISSAWFIDCKQRKIRV